MKQKQVHFEGEPGFCWYVIEKMYVVKTLKILITKEIHALLIKRMLSNLIF